MEDTKQVKKIYENVTYVKPNGALFGEKRILPPIGLWSYNYLKPKGKGKLSNWLYRSMSSEPVLVAQVNPEMKCKKIETELFNTGFFNVNAWSVIDTGRKNPKKAKISYFIKAENPYRINNISFVPAADAVDSLIIENMKELAFKPGDIFDLEKVKAEKLKTSAAIVEKGFYLFNPSCLQVIADTLESPYKLDLLIGKNNSFPDYLYKRYYVNRIKVTLTGTPTDENFTDPLSDTVFYDGILMSGLKNYLKPEVISRSVLFRAGDLYSFSKHQGTIQRLNNNGVFRYVKMQFSLQDTLNRKLDLNIDLMAMQDVSLNLEGNIESKSSGFAGPGAAVTLAHANVKKGANKLQLKLDGNFEWQWGTKDSVSLGQFSYSFGVNSSLIFPRLIIPFSKSNYSNLLMSRTILNLGYEFTNKVQYYRMSAIRLGFGYQWKKKQKISHIFYPVNLNLMDLLETTPEFDEIINTNPYVKKSFEEEFIAGMKYDLIYDNTQKKSNGTYAQFSLGTAGNIIELLKKNSGGERPYTILGNVYSQFVKASADLRYFTNTTKQGMVFRIYTGTGISYGNSTVMPYIEQFYSGGANSIRSFIARSLGPGNYKSEETSGLIDQTGDIKLEGNIEYRFPFSKTFKGAIFLDAGNVWLLNEDETRPGSEFKFSTFLDQLAVGTGIGFRFDFSFFVIRTDFGFPLRTPYATGNSNWLTTTKDVFNQRIFNLAIGYPF